MPTEGSATMLPGAYYAIVCHVLHVHLALQVQHSGSVLVMRQQDVWYDIM